MPNEIFPGNQRIGRPTYTKGDGNPGEVQAPGPEWSLSDDTLATLVVEPDNMSGAVQHNGASGEVTLTVRADGDLGEGVHPIVLSAVFTMMPPLGATGGSLGVGEEEPIPTP